MPTPRRRKGATKADPLEAYKRIRKPMPPPERVHPDKRRAIREREAERETREGEGGSGDEAP
jgi:hypothetical protein